MQSINIDNLYKQKKQHQNLSLNTRKYEIRHKSTLWALLWLCYLSWTRVTRAQRNNKHQYKEEKTEKTCTGQFCGRHTSKSMHLVIPMYLQQLNIQQLVDTGKPFHRHFALLLRGYLGIFDFFYLRKLYMILFEKGKLWILENFWHFTGMPFYQNWQIEGLHLVIHATSDGTW